MSIRKIVAYGNDEIQALNNLILALSYETFIDQVDIKIKKAFRCPDNGCHLVHFGVRLDGIAHIINIEYDDKLRITKAFIRPSSRLQSVRND